MFQACLVGLSGRSTVRTTLEKKSFQAQLASLANKYSETSGQFARVRMELCLTVQREIWVNYSIGWIYEVWDVKNLTF